MIGIIINPVAVIIGSFIGVFFHGRVPEKIRSILDQGMGLCIAVIGISGALKTGNVLVLIISVVAGSAVGTALRIEKRLGDFGSMIKKCVPDSGSDVGTAFVSASLIYCVGSMAVMGSIQAGMNNDPSILFAKSILDGIRSVVLASTLGFGVALSALPLLLYQGMIALLARIIGPLLSEVLVAEISAAGSILILALGLNQLGAVKQPIPVGDMLPSIFFPIAVLPLINLIS